MPDDPLDELRRKYIGGGTAVADPLDELRAKYIKPAVAQEAEGPTTGLLGRNVPAVRTPYNPDEDLREPEEIYRDRLAKAAAMVPKNAPWALNISTKDALNFIPQQVENLKAAFQGRGATKVDVASGASPASAGVWAGEAATGAIDSAAAAGVDFWRRIYAAFRGTGYTKPGYEETRPVSSLLGNTPEREAEIDKAFPVAGPGGRSAGREIIGPLGGMMVGGSGIGALTRGASVEAAAALPSFASKAALAAPEAAGWVGGSVLSDQEHPAKAATHALIAFSGFKFGEALEPYLAPLVARFMPSYGPKMATTLLTPMAPEAAAGFRTFLGMLGMSKATGADAEGTAINLGVAWVLHRGAPDIPVETKVAYAKGEPVAPEVKTRLDAVVEPVLEAAKAETPKTDLAGATETGEKAGGGPAARPEKATFDPSIPPVDAAEAEARNGVEPVPPEVTSVKNRVVNEEREARGVEDLAEPSTRSHEVANAEAAKIIEANPSRPRDLAREVAEKPRPLTDTDVMLLDRRRVDLHKDRNAAEADVIAAAERGDLDAVAAAKQRVAENSDEFLILEQASKAGGTESARGLAARVRMMAQDYSLPAMETRRRVENDGKRLTPEQAAETKALHEKLAKATTERDTYASRVAELEAQRAKAPRGLGSRSAPPRSSPEYGKSNKIVTRDAYEKALAAFKGTTLSAGIDPSKVAAAVKIGVFHLEAGTRSFAEWGHAMVETLGDTVKPHLRQVWEESRKRLGSEETALKGLKTRIKGQTTDYGARVELGVLEPPTRRSVPRDAEAVRLEANLETAKRKWNEALFKDKLANRNFAQKMLGATLETSAVARAVMTGLDVSAVLRQNIFSTLAHPVRAAKAIPEMFKAFFSPEAQARSEAEIRLRPTYARNKRAGLFQAEHGATSLSKMEEAYMTRWLDPMPLKPGETGRNILRGAFNAVTFPFAGSARAFNVFSNRMRMEVADAMAAGLSNGAEPTPTEMRAIAHAANVFTGRGGPSEAKSLGGLNYAFFSPRLLASRFQTLLGTPAWGGSARTRAAVAKEYGRFFAGVAVLYGLGKLAGASVETDPRSSDFGKLKFGDTRIDPMGGLLQIIVLEERLRTGEEKDKTGEISKTDFGTIARFLRTKLAPIPGAAISARFGKKPTGEETDLKKEALGLVTPMTIGDIYEAMKEQGVPAGSAMAVLSLFGMGLATYDSKKKSSVKGLGRK